jgi:hypothetical protein
MESAVYSARAPGTMMRIANDLFNIAVSPFFMARQLIILYNSDICQMRDVAWISYC